MNASKAVFGSGCLKNVYTFLDIKMPRKVSQREETLYEHIMKINNITSLSKNQKIWLTDRYLTYKFLEKINFKSYDEIKSEINSDIKNILQLKKGQEPKSAKSISLNQA